MTTTKLDPQPWMNSLGIQTIMSAYKEAGHSIRFVGGCVRDSLLGLEVHDIDMATDAIPAQGLMCLEQAGIKVIPTGIEHGTLTAIIDDKQPVEITTLREDIDCDGRHAEVVYSIDWQQDAQRRDFTMNALSADIDGTVHDYTGGVEDIQNGQVRFIGNADRRVQEDYLRILRYFRFWGRYQRDGRSNPDAVQACTAHAPQLATLSGERIQQEMCTLLKAPRVGAALELMQACDADPYIFRFSPDLELINRLTTIDAAGVSGWQVRLAALLRADEVQPEWIIKRWRLSNADAALLTFLSRADMLPADMPIHMLHRLIRRAGRGYAIRLLWLSQAWHDDNSKAYPALRKEASQWPIPTLPVTGQDVMSAGVPEGKAVGKVLKKLEALWEASQYTMQKQELLGHIAQ